MNKIKIIDLLNKIANGEEVPKKIKGRLNKIYTYSKYNTDYQDKEGKLLFYKLFQFRDKCLNDEVEVVEKATLDGENDLISLIPHKRYTRDIVERIYKMKKKSTKS